MKAKRIFNPTTQQYAVYLVPENHENIDEGIPVQILQLTADDLKDINNQLSEMLTQEIENTQTTPSLDTVANVLRKIIIKLVKNRGKR